MAEVNTPVSVNPEIEVEVTLDVQDTVSAKNAEAWAVGQRGGVDVGPDDPTYHNNSKYHAKQASGSQSAASGYATAAEGHAKDAEAYGTGKRNGADVTSEDPAYHNNAPYYAQQAAGSATSAGNARQAAETAQGKAETAMSKYPKVQNGTWWVWNVSGGAWTDTGVKATGEWAIVKTYASIAEMNADYSGTDVKIGEFVMVVSTVEDPDNAKLYVKGNSAYQFIVDMSGATGVQGPAAYVHIRWAAAQPTQDSDMKTVPDNWMGIYSDNTAADSTAYTSYTWFKVKGETGNTGAVPSIAVGTVTTGAAGSAASVTRRSGSPDTAPVFDFTIPKGDTGNTGATGATGATPQFTVGTVTDVPHGDDPAVQIDNTDPAHPVISFEIPHGASGNETIDDTAGLGDDDLVFSADKAEKDRLGLEGRKANSENLYLYKEASGEVVTVEDAVAERVKQMRVEIAPVQDLHGYGNPWPAGGSKNIIPMTLAGMKITNTTGTWSGNAYTKNDVTFTVDVDDGGNVVDIKTNGTASANVQLYLSGHNSSNKIPITNPTNYSISGGYGTSKARVMVWLYDSNGEYISLTASNAGTAAAITFANAVYYVPVIEILNGENVSGKTFYPMLRLTSESADFAPYSNICPISGWTGVKVTRTGKNLLNRTLGESSYNGVNFTYNPDGTVTTSGTASGVVAINIGTFTAKAGVTYILNGTPNSVTDEGTYIRFHGPGPSEYTYQYQANKANGYAVSFSFNEDTTGYVDIRISSGVNVTGLTFKPMIRFATVSDADFEPYNRTEYQITFPSSAGTVYGGTLTVNQDGTGTVVVDRASHTFTGSENWIVNGTSVTGKYRITLNSTLSSFLTDVKSAANNVAPNFKSNILKAIAGDSVYTCNEGIGIINGYMNLYTTAFNGSDAASQFASYISSNGFVVVYELATPVTYTLTTDQVADMLTGLNNVWADCGDILSLLYATDNKADKNGEYEHLVAGSAEQVLGMYTEEKVPYVYRQTPVASKRVREKIVGGTVSWNQLAKNGDFTNASKWTSNKGTFAVANNVGTYTITEIGAYVYSGSIQNVDAVNFITGHKVAIFCDVLAPRDTPVRLYILKSSTSGSNMEILKTAYANTWTKLAGMKEIVSGASYGGLQIAFDVTSGYSVNETIKVKNYVVFDLTAMFGSTIADYLYTLETNTAGAGVAWFRNLFPKDYYAYDAGSLQSVQVGAKKVTGKNWLSLGNNLYTDWFRSTENGTKINSAYPLDSSILRGTINEQTGSIVIDYYNTSGWPWISRLVKLKKNTNYVFTQDLLILGLNSIAQGTVGTVITVSNHTFNSGDYPYYMISIFPQNFNKTGMAIILADATDATFVPYETPHTYPFDSSLILRGIPKLDSNNKLYYDGDVYQHDGSVTRKYGIVDLGTLDFTKEDNGKFVKSSFTSAKAPANNTTKAVILCAKYATDTNENTYNKTTDKTISLSASNTLRIYDSAYTDSATLITALSGVYLVYELATQTTESAEPYQYLQICDGDGTEEFVDAGNRDITVPVGGIREYSADIWKLIADLQAAILALQD